MRAKEPPSLRDRSVLEDRFYYLGTAVRHAAEGGAPYSRASAPVHDGLHKERYRLLPGSAAAYLFGPEVFSLPGVGRMCKDCFFVRQL